MRDPDPTAYDRRDTIDGARFVLPRRTLGAARWFGLLPMLFGCFFSGFAIFWMWGASQSMWNSQGQFQWFGLPFTLFGIPFVLGGLAPIGIGLAVIVGRGEVIVRNGTLIAREKVGPFFWSRKRPTQGVERFELVRDFKIEGNNRKSMNPGNASAFRAMGAAIKPMVVAWGYDKAMLSDLANNLAELCEAHGPAKLLADDRQPIAVVDAPPPPEDEGAGDRGSVATLPDPPPNTKIILNVHDTGVTLTIPPAGLRSKGARSLLIFSLLWCGFMAVFTTLMIFGNTSGGGDRWVGILFVAGFWAIGVGMFLGALSMAKRRAIIDAIGFPPDAVLLVTRKGLFGTKQEEVAGADIAAVRMDNSGMEVNNRPVKNLQAHRKQGKKLALLTGRDEDELKWLAAVLRYALDVPAED